MPHSTPRPPSPAPRLIGTLMAGACGVVTIIALVAWYRTGSGRSLYIAGAFCVVASIITFIWRAVDELPDAISRLLVGVGITRGGEGFSDIESMVAQGHFDAAAESYRMRATGTERGPAILGRARLLADQLGQPEEAIREIDGLFSSGAALSPGHEIAFRLLLAETLESTGAVDRARRELQMLLTRYPSWHGAAVARSRLEALSTGPLTEHKK